MSFTLKPLGHVPETNTCAVQECVWVYVQCHAAPSMLLELCYVRLVWFYIYTGNRVYLIVSVLFVVGRVQGLGEVSVTPMCRLLSAQSSLNGAILYASGF